MIFLTALAIVLLSSTKILSASLHDACMTGNLDLAKLALEDPKLDVNLPDPDWLPAKVPFTWLSSIAMPQL